MTRAICLLERCAPPSVTSRRCRPPCPRDTSMATPDRVRDAVILAAGRGTRMKGLTEELPKPMLPVAGRPLLEHIVETLRTAGIERLVLITGYRSERIEEHF